MKVAPLVKKTGKAPLNNVWNSILTRNTKVTPTLFRTRRKFLEAYRRMEWISIYFTAVLMRVVADRSYLKFLQNRLCKKRELFFKDRVNLSLLPTMPRMLSKYWIIQQNELPLPHCQPMVFALFVLLFNIWLKLFRFFCLFRCWSINQSKKICFLAQ